MFSVPQNCNIVIADFSIQMKDTVIRNDYQIQNGAVKLHFSVETINKRRLGCIMAVFQLLHKLNFVWEHVCSILRIPCMNSGEWLDLILPYEMTLLGIY